MSNDIPKPQEAWECMSAQVVKERWKTVPDNLVDLEGVEHTFSNGVHCRVLNQLSFPQSTNKEKIVSVLKLKYDDGHHEYLVGYRYRNASPGTWVKPHHLTVPFEDLKSLIVEISQPKHASWICPD